MGFHRLKLDTAATYHVMSRIVDKQLIIKDLEKRYLRGLLSRLEVFTGCRIRTYAILENHFHILLHVPLKIDLDNREVKRRAKVLYGAKKYALMEDQWKQWQESGQQNRILEQLDKFRARMFDVSQFMKTFKQCFSIYYNLNHERRGTLWEERFKSVLVEESEYAQLVVGAYIDLNPVRAGMVKDPKDYRWSGYGEAVGGTKLSGAYAAESKRRICDLFVSSEVDEKQALMQYREILYTQGACRHDELSGQVIKPGFSRGQVDKVLDGGGRLPLIEVLHCKVRYFSDGMVIGGKAFVEKVLNDRSDIFTVKRRARGAKEMKFGVWGGLCAARELRVRVVKVLENPVVKVIGF